MQNSKDSPDRSVSSISSKLWQELASTLFSRIDDNFLGTFRAPGGANQRLAAWDPLDRSTRYYKTLLYNVAKQQPAEFFDAYRKLKNTSIGNPVTISVGGCQIDIDYLLAVEEQLFLKRHASLDSLKQVVEIGAGFGRTCHAILSLTDSVERYVIVDLPAMLKLSRAYLKLASPDHLRRVEFIECDDVAAWQRLRPDLTINIDSFQEMPPELIDRYMSGLIQKSASFYCKNPIGKYKPGCVGLPPPADFDLNEVYALGYCRTVFDLFDDEALVSARRAYLAAYRPPGAWKLAADMPTSIFSYVHHALYRAG